MDATSVLGGRYRLVERLGGGGMSVVWRGFDEVLQREVAVKLLAPDLPDDAGLRQRIRREAQAAARLCHPHIATVYDYGEAADDAGTAPASPYVVLELMTGPTLAGHLAGGLRLPWREAVTICAQVASALSEAHAHGVVHRDVKPGNVVLTPSGAKVVDFGISAVVGESELGTNGQLLGTPAYLAPERLDGGRADTAADVYALGLLLYRTLTGTLPWQAETPTEVLRAHRDVDPARLPPVPGLPAEVVRACHACLARAPERRPASRDVARTLAQAAGIPLVLRRAAVPVGSLGAAPASPAPPATLWDAGALVQAGARAAPLAAARPVGPPAPAAGPRDASWITGRTLTAGPLVRTVARHRAVLAIVVAGALAFGAATSLRPTGPSAPKPATEAIDVPPVTVGAPVAACRVRYQVQRDWRTGFDATVTVTNAGDTPIEDAAVQFAFPGDQVIAAETSVWAQSGHTVTGRLDGPARRLAPGKAARLTLTARYRSDNLLPTAFFLGGTACTALITGLGTPEAIAAPVVIAGPASASRGGDLGHRPGPGATRSAVDRERPRPQRGPAGDRPGSRGDDGGGGDRDDDGEGDDGDDPDEDDRDGDDRDGDDRGDDDGGARTRDGRARDGRGPDTSDGYARGAGSRGGHDHDRDGGDGHDDHDRDGGD